MDPNHFFLLGAAKSGTTSLYSSLNQHPDLHMTPTKEPQFFQLDREYEKGLDFYHEKYFEGHGDESIFGDAAHRHLYLPWIPDRILELLPEAKFAVILRNPVDRAYSHYWHWRRSGRPNTESEPFDRAIYQDYLRIKAGYRHRTEEEKQLYQDHLTDMSLGLYRTYLDSGYYHEQIKRYTDRVGRDRLKVVFFRDYIEDPSAVCNELFEFLKLSPYDIEQEHQTHGFVPRSDLAQALFSRGRSLAESLGVYEWIPYSFQTMIRSLNEADKTKESMSTLTRDWLSRHYEEHNNRLEQFLSIDLDHWSCPPDATDWTPVRRDVFGPSSESNQRFDRS
ncbi:MAG: sulfotransferase [bacterium]